MNRTSFLPKSIGAAILAALEACWVFPMLIIAYQVIDSPHRVNDEAGLILIFGSIFATIIGAMHSLVFLVPLTWLTRAAFLTDSTGKLIARLLPAHVLTIAVPFIAIGIVTGSLYQEDAIWGALGFIFHAECVMGLAVWQLRRWVIRGEERAVA